MLYSSHRDVVKTIQTEINWVEEEFNGEMADIDFYELEQTNAGKQLLEIIRPPAKSVGKSKDFWRHMRETARENERALRRSMIISRMRDFSLDSISEPVDEEKEKVKK